MEDDFEGAEQTLIFDTDRLKIFPEEYEMLKKMADEPDRILAKQLVFMVHEKEIKNHLKKEKQLKMEQRKKQINSRLGKERNKSQEAFDADFIDGKDLKAVNRQNS